MLWRLDHLARLRVAQQVAIVNRAQAEVLEAIGAIRLDRVIDLNFYPIAEAKRANLRGRPVGLR